MSDEAWRRRERELADLFGTVRTKYGEPSGRDTETRLYNLTTLYLELKEHGDLARFLDAEGSGY